MTLAGRLLVASPVMIDPNFFQSVVLVCTHDDEGAMGLVLDRPTGIAVADHLPSWGVVDPPEVFFGGPVQTETAIGLAEADSAVPGWVPVVGPTGLVDLGTVDPATVGRARVFAGYAGWSPGQLEVEIGRLDWIVIPGHPDDAFDEDPPGLRRRVLARQGGLVRSYAYFPPDPRLN